MVQCFQEDADDFDFGSTDGVKQAPKGAEVDFPKVSDTKFFSVFFGNLVFGDVLAIAIVPFEFFDSPFNELGFPNRLDRLFFGVRQKTGRIRGFRGPVHSTKG